MALLILTSTSVAPGQTRHESPSSISDATVPSPATNKSGSRRLFAALGIDQQRLKQLTDGTDLRRSEHEVFVRVLRRLNRFGDEAIMSWRHDQVPWQAIVESPDSYRLEIFAITGHVVRVQAVPLPIELARRFELKRPQFYQLSLQTSSHEQPVTVFSISVPRRWREHITDVKRSTGEASNDVAPSPNNPFSWNEKVRLSTWFMKLGSRDHDQPTFLFVTPRIEWFPDRPNPELGVTGDQVALAADGVDIGRLDAVRDETALGTRDREVFYQLLAATASDTEARPKVGDATAHLKQLFANPQSQRGNRFTFRGVARRAVRIEVDDPDIRRKYGIDHYYEMELFVGLPQSVRVLASKEDKTGKLFHAYPIVCCTQRLPEGLEAGELIEEEVAFTGNFLKLWAYTTQYMNQPSPKDATTETDATDGGTGRRKQVSPLLIGPQPVWYPSQVGNRKSWDWRWTVAAAIALGIVYWGLWRLTRADRQQRQFARQQREHPSPNPSFDDLPDVSEGPDFSHLE